MSQQNNSLCRIKGKNFPGRTAGLFDMNDIYRDIGIYVGTYKYLYRMCH